MIKRTLAAASLWLLLTAGMCATVPTPHPTPQVACLPVASYSAAQEAQFASAVAALPADNPLIRPLLDYAALKRAALAACRAAPAQP